MYSKRKWLNKDDSSSTGSIVCFSGLANWSEKGKKRTLIRFVEFGDCLGKVRIHQSKHESLEEYRLKISKLKTEIDNYLKYLVTEG